MQLAEKIKRGCLTDTLCIADWVTLRYPDPDNQPDFDDRIKKQNLRLDRSILKTDMIQACNDGLLKYVIVNDRVSLKKPKLNSQLLWDGPSLSDWGRTGSRPLQTNPSTDFRIHKVDFKQFLERIGKMPSTGFLASILTDHVEKGTNKHELTKWLRETWENEDRPEGTAFFDCLKKYVNKKDGPIVEHYTASKNGAGIRWSTGNATGTMAKKTIQSKVSQFKALIKKSCQ